MNILSGILILILTAYCACPGILAASDHAEPGPQAENRVLTLQEAAKMALMHSPQVLLAEAQASRAGEAARESRSLNRPQLVTGTGLAYNNGFPLSIEGAAPSIIQVAASQPIFSRKNANLIREAEESVKASRLGTESVRNDLAMTTALVYYDLYRARKVIDLATAGLDSAQKQLTLAETLLDSGRALPVDVSLARTAVYSARQRLLVAQEQAKLDESELRELTGLPDSVVIKTLEPRIESPIFELNGQSLYSEAIGRSPELLQAEANLRAKEYHVQAEKGERWPRLEIVSEYALFSRTNNYEDYFNRFTRNNYLLGLSVQVPIFDGFRTSARVAESRQEATEEQYRLQHMRSELKLDIERKLSALRIARSSSDLARSDVESTRESLQMNETLFESGKISSKNLEEFRIQLQQKELALLEADQTFFQRKLELLQAVGSIASAIR